MLANVGQLLLFGNLSLNPHLGTSGDLFTLGTESPWKKLGFDLLPALNKSRNIFL